MLLKVITAVGLAAAATVANAETWIATCTDGSELGYNQPVGGQGELFLMNTRIAHLRQTFHNGTAICGSIPGNGIGTAATGRNPVTQICANRSRGIIYLKYKHPWENRPFEDTVYCQATVRVR